METVGVVQRLCVDESRIAVRLVAKFLELFLARDKLDEDAVGEDAPEHRHRDEDANVGPRFVVELVCRKQGETQ